jgi:hypothetical protein
MNNSGERNSNMGPLSYFIIFMGLMTATPGSPALISADSPFIQYFGRFDRTQAGHALFDWPGVAIQAVFEGTSCSAVLEGAAACFDMHIDGTFAGTIMNRPGMRVVPLAGGLSDGRHLLRLEKRSESTGGPVSFGGFGLDSGKRLVKPPKKPVRKIEFIGDSYTAGFANEHEGRECDPAMADSIILVSSNANRAFGPLAAAAFGAQYQIIALAGKGLVRNFNGIDPGKELPALYDRTLCTSINTPGPYGKWQFSSWKADMAVIGIGVNDFQADPPYADTGAFDRAYARLIGKLRAGYPGVRIVCCATRVWPIDALIPRVKSIVGRQKAEGHDDVVYFEYATENNALYGHPSLKDHRAIADSLIPVIAKITGWKTNAPGRAR